jgi:hypothetical protein
MAQTKAIVVDLATQVFGAYESGELVRWGPVSSGRRSLQTTPGTYHLNWRSRVRISSDDPTWIMPWYFNFSETAGFAFHQYTLPGRPASHGCVRMLLTDAKWLFYWGQGRTIEGEGTLVLVLGNYDFTAERPWRLVDWWAQGVTLPTQEMALAK